MGSLGPSCGSLGCTWRRLREDCFLSITCVVEIFTTAGSTRLTIDANELEDGMASGIASGVAPLAENAIVLIAAVRPETTEPIKIPTISVSATNKAAMVFSRRDQLTISFTGSPMALAPVFRSATNSLEVLGGRCKPKNRSTALNHYS